MAAWRRLLRGALGLVLLAAAGVAAAGVIEDAQALLAEGRAGDAVTKLEAARRENPADRALLQELIRAYAARRAQPLTAGATAAPPPPAGIATPPQAARPASAQTSLPAARDRSAPCWAGRLRAALDDCERERAQRGDSAELLDRIGDLQRSLGQVPAALAAYRRSLELAPTRRAVARKVDALSTLAAPGPAPVVQAAAAPPQTAATPPPAAAGRTYALLIGNNRYPQYPALAAAIADVQLIAGLLRERYGFEVEMLENATRRQTLDALAQLRRRTTTADRVLIYYAGHGLRDEATGRGYWLPVDAETDNIANWISNDDIANMLRALPARHALVIADSCFAGTLTRSAAAQLDARATVLQRLAARRSRAVLSSGGLEPVLDSGGGGRHSVFAQALADVLGTQEDPLEASRVFSAVRDRVVRSADQTPQYATIHAAGDEGGEFIFAPLAAANR